MGTISAQPHTIVKQICCSNGNLLFLSFSLSKNWMHNVVWGCAEILPKIVIAPKNGLSCKVSISRGRAQLRQLPVMFTALCYLQYCVRPFTQNVDSPVKQGTVKEFVTAILCPYHQVWQELRTCLKKLQFVYDIVERSKSKTIAAHRRFPTDILLN